MAENNQEQVTRLLGSVASGGEGQLDELVGLVYDELKLMAHHQLLREAGGHTLQTTALVHEAYLKLVNNTAVGSRGRAYFFAAAARAMRQVLVDHGRRRATGKRGGGMAALELDAAEISIDTFAAELLELNDALDQLAALNARQSRVVECRYFGGLSVEETAAALGISERTVKSDWALARAWLFGTLRPDDQPG
jgi:RNA polymerase sigma factor (TIGR02999 family)